MGIRLFFFSLLFISMPVSASCGSRGFGSTYGTGATDKITTGFTAAPGVTSSFSAWVWLNGAGGAGSGGRIIDKVSGSNGVFIDNANATNVIRYGRFWTSSTAQWTMPFTTGSWRHVCITYDGSSTLNSPVMYLDGVSQTVTVLTPGVGSVTNTGSIAAVIGNRAASDRTFDGKIAEPAYWSSDILTASDCLALAHGASPQSVHRATLSPDWPLCGGNGEPDYGPAHVSQTITGTVAQLGPPSGGNPFQGVTGQ